MNSDLQSLNDSFLEDDYLKKESNEQNSKIELSQYQQQCSYITESKKTQTQKPKQQFFYYEQVIQQQDEYFKYSKKHQMPMGKVYKNYLKQFQDDDMQKKHMSLPTFKRYLRILKEVYQNLEDNEYFPADSLQDEVANQVLDRLKSNQAQYTKNKPDESQFRQKIYSVYTQLLQCTNFYSSEDSIGIDNYPFSKTESSGIWSETTYPVENLETSKQLYLNDLNYKIDRPQIYELDQNSKFTLFYLYCYQKCGQLADLSANWSKMKLSLQEISELLNQQNWYQSDVLQILQDQSILKENIVYINGIFDNGQVDIDNQTNILLNSLFQENQSQVLEQIQTFSFNFFVAQAFDD